MCSFLCKSHFKHVQDSQPTTAKTKFVTISLSIYPFSLLHMSNIHSSCVTSKRLPVLEIVPITRKLEEINVLTMFHVMFLNTEKNISNFGQCGLDNILYFQN